MNFEDQFSKRLYELRTNKNISARDMSLSMDFNPNYINMIESGKSYPSLIGFFQICKFLNITPKDFFEIDIKDTDKFNELIENIKKLQENDLITIENLVKSLSKK